MTLKGLIIERKLKERKRPQLISPEKRKHNVIEWTTFYRRNINIYASHRLKINIHPFQHIMIYLMSISQVFFAICTRGLSKTFTVGLFSICKACLYPYSEIVLTATTITQATKMVKEKMEGEIVRKLSPVLNYFYKRGLIKFSYNDEDVRVDFLFNGSCIKVLPSKDSSRGSRATVIIYEECRLLKKGMVDSVFEPMSHPRQAKFLQLPEYNGNKRWIEESQSIYITSARFKSEWFWKTFTKTVGNTYNNKHVIYNFFAADIYLSLLHGLKTISDFRKAKSTMSELDFRMEILNEMIGEAQDAFFTLDMFRKNQILKIAFKPPLLEELYGGKPLNNKDKKPNEYRLIYVDFAFSNTTSREKNDNSIIGCMSLFYNNEKIKRNIDYITTHPASDSLGAEKKVRELFWDYQSDFIVMDLRNGGEVIYNNLTKEYIHPERGNEWNRHGFTVYTDENLHVVPKAKLEDLINRTVDPQAIPAIIPIIGTSELNSIMWLDLQNRLRNSDIRFLIDEMEYQDILENNKRFYTMTNEEKVREKLPYIETLLTINEAINLSQMWNNGIVKLSEPRSGTKDRIVSCSYGNYVATLLENKLSIKAQDSEFDIGEWKLVF